MVKTLLQQFLAIFNECLHVIHEFLFTYLFILEWIFYETQILLGRTIIF